MSASSIAEVCHFYFFFASPLNNALTAHYSLFAGLYLSVDNKNNLVARDRRVTSKKAVFTVLMYGNGMHGKSRLIQ